MAMATEVKKAMKRQISLKIHRQNLSERKNFATHQRQALYSQIVAHAMAFFSIYHVLDGKIT